MNLSVLTVGDVEALTQFEKENFNDGWNEQMLYSSFETGRFFGYKLTQNHKIIAFITYSVTLDTADVESVVVAKDYRKKGYASLLIESAIKDAQNKGAKRLFLEVRKSNTPAINLYEKFGFKQLFERKKYYGDGEDALVLQKEIL